MLQGCWPQRHPEIAQPFTNAFDSNSFFSACDACKVSRLLQSKLLALGCPARSFLAVHSVKQLSETILWIVGLWKVAPAFLTVVQEKVTSGLLRIFLLLETPNFLCKIFISHHHKLAKISEPSDSLSFSKLWNSIQISSSFK